LYRAIDYEALHGFHSPTPYRPAPFYCHGALHPNIRPMERARPDQKSGYHRAKAPRSPNEVA